MTMKVRCDEGKPFVTVGQGDPPTLEYNLPQGSCFHATGLVRVDVAESAFLDEHRAVPERNWWLEDWPRKLDKLPGVADGSRVVPGLDREVVEVVQQGRVNRRGRVVMGAAEAPARTALQPAASVRRPDRAGDGAARHTATATRARSDEALPVAEPQPFSVLADGIQQGLRPMLGTNFYGEKQLQWIPEPKEPRPRLIVIEYYRICSYLGDYGAGRVLNTFSLLPGEETEITMKTYRDVETTRERSENILDSFSESSALEMEDLLEIETGNTYSESDSTTSSDSKGGGVSVGIDVLGIVQFGADHQGSKSSSSTASTTRDSYADTLDRTLSKHVENSSSSREVEVNTSSKETVSEGEEESTVRKIANINHSRVLNFVFRQMMQEYFTITYLDTVRFAFTNGYPEDTVLFDMAQVDDVLPTLVKADQVEAVKAKLLAPYCAVLNHRGEVKPFLEQVHYKVESCPFTEGEEISFYRKDPNLVDEANGVEVHGVILKVRHHTLRTAGVITEALLGQGEALDCYNQNLQAAAADQAALANRRDRLALDIVESFPTPAARARAYHHLLVEEAESGEAAVADDDGGEG